LRREVDWTLFRCLKRLVEEFGKYIALVICFFLSFLFIFLSAFYPTDQFKFLLTYMYQVHAVSLLLEYAYCLAIFTPFYLEVRIWGRSFFCAGSWLKEKREERAMLYGASQHIKRSIWCCIFEVKSSCWCEGKEQVAVAPAPIYVAANDNFSLPPTASSPRATPDERLEKVGPQPISHASPSSSPRIVPVESSLHETPVAPSTDIVQDDDGNVEMMNNMVEASDEERVPL